MNKYDDGSTVYTCQDLITHIHFVKGLRKSIQNWKTEVSAFRLKLNRLIYMSSQDRRHILCLLRCFGGDLTFGLILLLIIDLFLPLWQSVRSGLVFEQERLTS